MRKKTASGTWSAIVLSVLLVIGCGKSEVPSLSVQSSPASASTNSEPRLEGTWLGEFVFHADVDREAFDQVTLDACKSMQLRITFRADGTMAMAAKITLPEVGTQSNESQGTWSLVNRQGETVTIRSQEDGGEPEEVTLFFRGADVFEMVPPNQLKSLGVMRFVRQAAP